MKKLLFIGLFIFGISLQWQDGNLYFCINTPPVMALGNENPNPDPNLPGDDYWDNDWVSTDIPPISCYTNKLQGIVGTTPSGALTYAIPIEIPVGTAGLQPQLAIVYNSQNVVNGILGAGFGLSGLSSITRIGKNFHHDNERTGVELTMDDKFALDGMRLLRQDGGTAFGLNGVFYDTEIASFSDIVSFGHGVNNYLGPQRFEVRTKDGFTLHYGESGNSRVQHSLFGSTDTIVSQWLLSRKEDANGNFVQFIYYPDSGRLPRIKEIRYTGNNSAGLTPAKKLVFHYGNKPFSNQRALYIAGRRISDDRYLREIVCYFEDSVVKTYRFVYTADRRQLLYLREFSPSNELLGELKFNWQTPAIGFAPEGRWCAEFGVTPSTGSWNVENNSHAMAHITGNGRADIIGFGNEHVVIGESFASIFYPYPSLGAVELAGANWDANKNPRYAVDLTGRGRADLVSFSDDGVRVSSSSGNTFGNFTFNSSSVWTTEFTGDAWNNAQRFPRHFADFNGDGLLDIIGHGGWLTLVALNNNGAGFSSPFGLWDFSPGICSPYLPSESPFNYENGQNISLVGDINGDGRADIVVLQKLEHGGLRVFRSLSGGNHLMPVESQFFHSTFHLGNLNHSFLQDVNGDGMADLVFQTANGLAVAISNGDGFYEPVLWTFDYGWQNFEYTLKVIDINGDGLPDVVAFDSLFVYVSLNLGGSFAPKQRWTQTDFWGSHQLQWTPEASYNFRTMVDVNGDGLPDLVGFGWNGVYVSLNQSRNSFPLLSVEDNLGKQFTATYEMTNSTQTTLKYPLTNVKGLQVVTRLQTRTNDKTFTYENGISHLRGRGFLGFSQITEVDSRLQTKQITEFVLDTTHFLLLPSRTQLNAFNNTPISEHTQTHRIRPVAQGQRRIVNEVLQTTSKDFLTGVQQTSTFTYDGVGNLLSDTTTRGTIGAAPIARFVTQNFYIARAGRTIPNRLELTESHSYYIASASQRFSQKQHFSYDGNGNLTKTINRYGTTIADTTRYTLNPHGLVTQITRSASGIVPITQSFGYDTHFRFQTTQTSELGRTGQSYNIWGQILTDTAIGGQITRHQYDQFGRLVKTISPEGFVTTYTTRREKNTPRAVYYTLVEQQGRPYVKTYLDVLGRVIRTETPNFSGVVVAESKYNNRGLLTHVSEPRFVGEPIVKRTIFEYDFAGRKTREIFQYCDTIYFDPPPPPPPVDPCLTCLGVNSCVGCPCCFDFDLIDILSAPGDSTLIEDNLIDFPFDKPGLKGLITTNAYNGLTLTVTDPTGRASSKTYNAAGDLEKVIDPMDGEIIYTYRAPGFVETIAAPGNAVTTITYDQHGRQTSIIDPNAGTITYQYDAFDRITKQTDARGSVTINEYDNFGRLSKITEGSRITTYNYISTGANKGRLQSIVCNNGTAHRYVYDNLGRITQFIDSISENPLTTSYTYDDFGRLDSYTYPSNYRVNYTYNTHGFKTHIRQSNNDALIWQLNEVNALGQELNSWVVGNRTRAQTYNNFGQPLTMAVSDLMHYTYTYNDSTGNMISRNNSSFNGQNDFFSYDNLNRLISGGITYSDNGNIRTKAGVGNYIYYATQKHAVKAVSNPFNKNLDHNITYTSFGKVETIDNDNISATASFVYGPTHQRRLMNVLFSSNQIIKHYTQNYEVSIVNGNTIETKEYIFSPYSLVAIRNNGQLNAVATDHLGSIVAEFNPHKNTWEYFGYDAWGRRYLYENGEKHYFDQKIVNCQLSIVNFFQRGYTGHEHLDLLGLINMNGRMYDPMLGRFLSPDPYVQSPTFSQSFNRYSYVWNNPLRYIDPSGYFTESNWGLGSYLDGWVGGANFDFSARFKATASQSLIAPCWFGGGGGWSPTSGGSLYGQSWATIDAVHVMRTFNYGSNFGWSMESISWFINSGTYFGGHAALTLNFNTSVPGHYDGTRDFFLNTKHQGVADALLLIISAIFGVENMHWHVRIGKNEMFYFEPLEGYASQVLEQRYFGRFYFESVGYQKNRIGDAYFFTPVHNGFLQIGSIQAQILGWTHTHPGSSYPSGSDQTIARWLNSMAGQNTVRNRVVGWNGAIAGFDGFNSWRIR